MEPIAQGDAPDVKPADGQVAEQNGVEKRINELTAQRYEAQRRAEQAEAREQAYLAQMAELMAQRNVQQAEPAVQVDPEQKRAFEAMMAPMKREFENAIRELQKLQGLSQIRQAQNVTDPVQRRAEEIIAQYAKQNYRIDPEMALDLAAGQIARQQMAEQNAAKAAGRAFNGSGAPILTTQSMPNLGSTESKRPDLDKMTLQERLQYWDSQPGMRL